MHMNISILRRSICIVHIKINFYFPSAEISSFAKAGIYSPMLLLVLKVGSISSAMAISPQNGLIGLPNLYMSSEYGLFTS